MTRGRSQPFRSLTVAERFAAAARGPLHRMPGRRLLKRAFDAVLERVARDRLVSRLPHGEVVRIGAAYRQITWNPEEYEAFRRDVKPGDVVFDVGANVGAYAILFAHWVGPGGRIVAFEPCADARRGLEIHAALNGVSQRMSIRSEAVSAGRGVACLIDGGSSGSSRCVPQGGHGTEVPATSIDEVCRELAVRPSFIKIDVEGAELDVLRGARETIAQGGAALKLYVELHASLWPDCGVTRSGIEAELARQGLRPEGIDGSGDVWSIEGVCVRLVPCAS